MKIELEQKILASLFGALFMFFCMTSCRKEINSETQASRNATGTQHQDPAPAPVNTATEAILLVIDEESIDNGNPPNNFSETDVNDHIAAIGQRTTLRYFKENEGDTIDLFSGEVGDEGWHAVKTIPAAWKTAGPGTNGSRNFLLAGLGLGGGNDGPEVLLDKIPAITPLRATGLKMLERKTILAVVFDGDVSINYNPLDGSLKGANLGMVALEVVKVTRRTGGSSGSLPRITVRIVNVEAAASTSLKLFSNAPAPLSSSEPFDIAPPASAPAIQLTDAQ